MEAKSGSEYKTHVALNNALSVKEDDISEAYVLADNNVTIIIIGLVIR